MNTTTQIELPERVLEAAGRFIHKHADSHRWDFEDCSLCPDMARELVDEVLEALSATVEEEARLHRLRRGTEVRGEYRIVTPWMPLSDASIDRGD